MANNDNKNKNKTPPPEPPPSKNKNTEKTVKKFVYVGKSDYGGTLHHGTILTGTDEQIQEQYSNEAQSIIPIEKLSEYRNKKGVQ